MTDKPVFTVPEFAELVGTSEWTIYEGIKRGEIPTVPGLGRRKVIPGRWVARALDPQDAA